MTTVTIHVRGGRYRVAAVGHAGDPIICSGISALMCMAAGCMVNRARKIETQIIDDGLVVLNFRSWSPRLREDIRALTIGLLQIQETHPDNIRVDQNIFPY